VPALLEDGAFSRKRAADPGCKRRRRAFARKRGANGVAQCHALGPQRRA
jgi:hypothetical protein